MIKIYALFRILCSTSADANDMSINYKKIINMKATYSLFKVTLLITMMILLATEVVNAQGWYDVNWQYRRPVSVPNSGGTTLTDFQVKITLDNSFDFSKVKTDGGDVRITIDDGITLIPYWIETWDNVGTAGNDLGENTEYSGIRNNHFFVLWEQ